MPKRINHQLPDHMTLITPDLYGKRLDTGVPIPTHQTGIAKHTQQLICGFCKTQTSLCLTVTRNIFTGSPATYQALTPEGQIVRVKEIQVGFGDYLNDPQTGKVDPKLFKYHYEDDVQNPKNPIYELLAGQYAGLVRSTQASVLLLQNAIPLVSLLKIEELGYLDITDLGQLTTLAIIHDVEGYRKRLGYVRERLYQTKLNIKLIAISHFVRQELEALAVPKERIFHISNGIDIQEFDERMSQSRVKRLFDEVRIRNRLPENGKIILVTARRVEHKGHLDVIHAIKLLQEQGSLKDTFVAFTGRNMTTFHSPDYENKIIKTISENKLGKIIYLLDELSNDEIYACYGNAYASILASTQPEGFGYANLEAMLAGIPVIASNLGGPLDYITNQKTGMLVEPNNPNAIAVALKAILYDQTLYQQLCNWGRKEAEQFSVSRMINGYLAVISG